MMSRFIEDSDASEDASEQIEKLTRNKTIELTMLLSKDASDAADSRSRTDWAIQFVTTLRNELLEIALKEIMRILDKQEEIDKLNHLWMKGTET